MNLKDLPESLQILALNAANVIIRNLEGQPIELMDLIDKAILRGIEIESTRHNSKAENLYQVLLAFRGIVGRQPFSDMTLIETLSLVDQCLVENKPELL